MVILLRAVYTLLKDLIYYLSNLFSELMILVIEHIRFLFIAGADFIENVAVENYLELIQMEHFRNVQQQQVRVVLWIPLWYFVQNLVWLVRKTTFYIFFFKLFVEQITSQNRILLRYW